MNRAQLAVTAAAAAATVAAAANPPGAPAAEPPTTGVSFETRRLTDVFYCEGASVADFNRDNHADVVSGPFWYAGPTFEEKHAIYPEKAFAPKGYSDNFLTFTGDIDADGWPDVLVFGWPGKEVFWFANPGAGDGDGGWKKHLVIPVADNESPYFGDITGDGKPEVVCSVGERFVVATPGDDPAKPWESVFISEEKTTNGKYTHGLGVGDVNGDGRLDLIDKNSWWEQPPSLEGAPLWKRHRYQFAGPGGAQMFAYDFDGDGDNDILTSLHAHAWGLAWFEQAERDDGTRTFIRHLIIGEKPEENPYGIAFSQMHAIDMADVDGDGHRDIVTGKRFWAHNGNDPGGNMPAVLYWIKTIPGGSSGKATFVPYKIHDDSGVGTQVTAADITGDQKVDIIVGNKKGTHLHLQNN